MPKRREIPRMFGEAGAEGRTWYYWKPETRLRRLGWKTRALGSDKAEATRIALDLNVQIQGTAPRLVKLDALRAANRGHVAEAIGGDCSPEQQAELLAFFNRMLDVLTDPC